MGDCTVPFVLSKLGVIARNSDWLVALFVPVVTGWSYYGTLVLVFQQSFKNCSERLNKIRLNSEVMTDNVMKRDLTAA